MTTTLLLMLLVGMAAGQERSFPITIADGLAPAAGALIEVTLRFDASVPETFEVVRLNRSGSDRSWRLAGVTRHSVAADRLTAPGTAGVETLLLLRSPAHAGYILEGPFRWPPQPASALVSVQWRRTLRGRSPGTTRTSPAWLGEKDDERRPAWPDCRWLDRSEWECIGVPLDEAGVLVFAGAQGHLVYGIAGRTVVAAGLEAVNTSPAAWGRLLVVTSPSSTRQGSEPEEVRVSVFRVRLSRTRPQSNRIETEVDAGVKVQRIGDLAYWLFGNDLPGDGWIEVGGKGLAPGRLGVREVSVAPAELPLRVTLEPSIPLSGRVIAGTGRGAPGTVVTLSRFLLQPEDGDRRSEKRIAIAEKTTDGDGAFRFDDLAAESYDVLAMHPVFGRGERRVEPGGQEIEISLTRSAVATGRVLRDHMPVAGVPVAVVPDLAQFAASQDMTVLRGGETSTDREGRFTVALASRGSAELRIGDERTGVRRVPLGPAEALPPVVNIGTIEIGGVPPVTLVLEQSEGCELLLTGPAGRTGLTVARSIRLGPAMFQATLPEPGVWHVVAVCDTRERVVLPATIAVPSGAHDVTIRLTWPIVR